MAFVRQSFTEDGDADRETAILRVARAAGFERTGGRIREEIDNSLRTAVRRGILANEGEALRLLSRTIEGYARPFLKEQFLASLKGHAWTERDDAVREFARWMGFRRTGHSIDETARSLINGLLREGGVEADGDRIRRT